MPKRLRRCGRKLSFVGVSRVLAEVLVLRGLHREQRMDGVPPAYTQPVSAPHGDRDGREHSDHHSAVTISVSVKPRIGA